MKRVQKILPKALSNELTELGQAHCVMRRWDEVVGASLASRSWPDRYDRGVLWVAVEGSAWAQELRLMKIKILARMSDLAGKPNLFCDIRFGVRRLPKREESAAVEESLSRKAETTISEIARRRLDKWRDVEPN